MFQSNRKRKRKWSRSRRR